MGVVISVGVDYMEKIQSFPYNAENRLTTVTEPPAMGGGTETLVYDGSGRRVQKILPSGTTNYVYDAFGRLAAEYSTNPSESPCTTCYLSYDHLGSVRMVTDASANVISRHDFLPFGEELPPNSAGRNGQWGPGDDNITQKFTGQIRDEETDLDYFNARYFGAALGRFTSPDPKNAGADPMNPQSWNAYAYGANSPLNAIDPNGLSARDRFSKKGPRGTQSLDDTATGGGGISLSSTYAPGAPTDTILGNDIFEALAGAAGTQLVTAGGQIGFTSSLPSPFQFEFTGTFYGKTYNQTFPTVDSYTNWRAATAAEPESQAYAAYTLDCAHSTTPCTGNDIVTTRYQGTTGNYALPRSTLNPASVTGMIPDPSITSNAMHGGPSWYDWSLVGTGHVATNLLGEVESHFDTFSPIFLSPLHFLVDVFPSFFINPKPGVPGPKYTCSLEGGCH